MSQKIAWGTGASVTFPTGQGFLAASVRLAIRQGVTTATGFQQGWRAKQGTVKEYTVTIGGVLTYGTSSDDFYGGASAITMPVAGAIVTITFASGCTFSDTMVQSDANAGTSIESTGDASYTFEGPTSLAGPTTVAWAVS